MNWVTYPALPGFWDNEEDHLGCCVLKLEEQDIRRSAFLRPCDRRTVGIFMISGMRMKIGNFVVDCVQHNGGEVRGSSVPSEV